MEYSKQCFVKTSRQASVYVWTAYYGGAGKYYTFEDRIVKSYIQFQEISNFKLSMHNEVNLIDFLILEAPWGMAQFLPKFHLKSRYQGSDYPDYIFSCFTLLAKAIFNFKEEDQVPFDRYQNMLKQSNAEMFPNHLDEWKLKIDREIDRWFYLRFNPSSLEEGPKAPLGPKRAQQYSGCLDTFETAAKRKKLRIRHVLKILIL